jgi:hypothetical protein
MPRLFVIVVLLSLCGCATGPEYAEIRSSIPAVESGKGRVYLYRLKRAVLNVGTVTLNDKAVPVPWAGEFFYVDSETGEYEVVIDSTTVEKLSFRLDAGEEAYVRITPRVASIYLYAIFPELIDQDIALPEMQGLKYAGPNLEETEK